ncbi:hypothetical protein F4819DRAFT_488969 [Hypoxylon fuscum]|nr:hypothetical protein F4819DRAFT_488969 [Hypoxylon fuscum]
MAPVAFQIISDLHLETESSYNYPIKQSAPYLALLGDVGRVMNDDFFKFLERQLKKYWTVFFVLGSNEPVGTSWEIAKRKVRNFADRIERLRMTSTIGKFVFLDQARHDVNDSVTVLGCTLFSNVASDTFIVKTFDKMPINSSLVQHWTLRDHAEAHRSDLLWLNAQVDKISKAEPQREIIVFTHHSPTLDEKSFSQNWDREHVRLKFFNNLAKEECWTNPSVICWGFGQNHLCCDFTNALGKRIVSNQKGDDLLPCSGFESKKTFILGKQDPTKSTGLL